MPERVYFPSEAGELERQVSGCELRFGDGGPEFCDERAQPCGRGGVGLGEER